MKDGNHWEIRLHQSYLAAVFRLTLGDAPLAERLHDAYSHLLAEKALLSEAQPTSEEEQHRLDNFRWFVEEGERLASMKENERSRFALDLWEEFNEINRRNHYVIGHEQGREAGRRDVFAGLTEPNPG